MRFQWLPVMGFMLIASTCFSQDATNSQQISTNPSKQSVNPGINDSFLADNLDVDQYVQRFEVESREIFRARNQIVAALKLKPGDRIADVGTGTGLFIEPFSKAVGSDGWVYATDIAPKFVQRAENLATEKSLKNVSPLLSGQDDVRLAPGTVDALFLCDVYHHFEFPADSLRSIYKAVKPGGQFVVIDFNRIEGVSREWLLGHVRAGKDVFRAEIEAAGFEFSEEVSIEGFDENYFLRFRRP